jgi:predicted phosphodiesterase
VEYNPVRMNRISLLSDIHGNLPALQAVMADLRKDAPDAVYVLGDMTNGCPWSAEVLDLLSDAGWPMLLGNHDDAVLQLETPRMEPRYAHRDRYAALWWTRGHLTTRHLAMLEALPLDMSPVAPDAPTLRLVHGLPGNFFVGLRPDSPDEWVRRKLAKIGESTIAAGHTHVPMVRQIGKWCVVNCGAVGAPYDGDVRASYARLSSDGEQWRVDIRRVEYNISEVDAGFRSSGLAAEGGAMGEMFRRSVISGQPWVADFAWWVREQPSDALASMQDALNRYDATHGPGRWAFPYVR